MNRRTFHKNDVVLIYHWWLWTKSDDPGFHGKIGVIKKVRGHNFEIETSIYDEEPEIFFINTSCKSTVCGEPEFFELKRIGKL